MAVLNPTESDAGDAPTNNSPFGETVDTLNYLVLNGRSPPGDRFAPNANGDGGCQDSADAGASSERVGAHGREVRQRGRALSACAGGARHGYGRARGRVPHARAHARGARRGATIVRSP